MKSKAAILEFNVTSIISLLEVIIVVTLNASSDYGEI